MTSDFSRQDESFQTMSGPWRKRYQENPGRFNAFGGGDASASSAARADVPSAAAAAPAAGAGAASGGSRSSTAPPPPPPPPPPAAPGASASSSGGVPSQPPPPRHRPTPNQVRAAAERAAREKGEAPPVKFKQDRTGGMEPSQMTKYDPPPGVATKIRIWIDKVYTKFVAPPTTGNPDGQIMREIASVDKEVFDLDKPNSSQYTAYGVLKYLSAKAHIYLHPDKVFPHGTEVAPETRSKHTSSY